MEAEMKEKLVKIKQEYLEHAISAERISYLQQSLSTLVQENNEKWHNFRTKVKSGELNADPEALQLSLEEEALVIGRVQLWLMDEIALAPEVEVRNLVEPSDIEPAATNTTPSLETDKMPAAKKYMNSLEVADYLGISVHTIRRWASEQRIPVSTLNGKHNRFIKEEIDKWVLENGKKVIG